MSNKRLSAPFRRCRVRGNEADRKHAARQGGTESRGNVQRRASVDGLQNRVCDVYVVFSAGFAVRLHETHARPSDQRAVAPKTQSDRDLIAWVRRVPAGRYGWRDIAKGIDRRIAIICGLGKRRVASRSQDEGS